MKLTALITCSLLAGSLLVSCKTSLKNFTPPHLIPPHANDAPGLEASRKIERDKRQKDGTYKVGEELPVAGGKAMLFTSNPDYDVNAKPVGQLVDATSAKVLFCEGLYYFVETNEKDRGYIRETDLLSPNAQNALPTPAAESARAGSGVSSGAPTSYPGDITPLPASSGGLFPDAGGPLLGGGDAGAPTRTTSSGRVVNIKTRDTGRSKDFEKVKASLEKREQEKQQSVSELPPIAPASSADSIPSLPEPSGNFGN